MSTNRNEAVPSKVTRATNADLVKTIAGTLAAIRKAPEPTDKQGGTGISLATPANRPPMRWS